MLSTAIASLTGLWLWAAPASAPSIASDVQQEIDRLAGHTLRVESGRYQILDIAGEGPPRVGCVVKSERGLELHSAGERFLLRGPLAIPRIAGPNYKVWVIGTVQADGTLAAQRLGILAGPSGCVDRGSATGPDEPLPVEAVGAGEEVRR